MNAFVKWINDPQTLAKLRHLLTYVAGIITAFGFTSLSPDMVQKMMDALLRLAEQTGNIVNTLATISGMALAIYSALTASHKASPTETIKTVTEMAKDPTRIETDDAKKALIVATDSLPQVSGIVLRPTLEGTKLADTIPSPTVVPAGTPEAANIAH